MVQSIQVLNWTTNDLLTRKQPVYIDKIMNLLQIFSKRLGIHCYILAESIVLDAILESSFDPMPYRVRRYIWEYMTTHIGEMLIEGLFQFL